jgi:hypothetical protein
MEEKEEKPQPHILGACWAPIAPIVFWLRMVIGTGVPKTTTIIRNKPGVLIRSLDLFLFVVP